MPLLMKGSSFDSRILYLLEGSAKVIFLKIINIIITIIILIIIIIINVK